VLFLPNSPSWDSNSLNDTDHHLRHEDEKEGHEVERTVCPAKERVNCIKVTHNDMITIQRLGPLLKHL